LGGGERVGEVGGECAETAILYVVLGVCMYLARKVGLIDLLEGLSCVL